MTGENHEYELNYIVLNGIAETIKIALKRGDIEAVEPLRVAVDYYEKEFEYGANILRKELDKLRKVK